VDFFLKQGVAEAYLNAGAASRPNQVWEAFFVFGRGEN
jgi:hypothetical protein